MEAPPEPARITGVSSRAWYGASITDFLKAQPDTIVGQLVRNGNFALLPTQKDAWLAQIGFLQDRLVGLTGSLFLEFNIPRMGRRIDAVLLVGPVVFVIEFKVGESTFDRAAVDQVWDYALDLKNFHEASHSVSIVPILIATEATEIGAVETTRRRGQGISPDSGASRRFSRSDRRSTANRNGRNGR